MGVRRREGDAGDFGMCFVVGKGFGGSLLSCVCVVELRGIGEQRGMEGEGEMEREWVVGLAGSLTMALTMALVCDLEPGSTTMPLPF